LMTMAILKNSGQVLYRIFLNWDLSNAFLTISMVLYDFERKTAKAKMPSLHHVQVYICC
jgi:hypothetical protein